MMKICTKMKISMQLWAGIGTKETFNGSTVIIVIMPTPHFYRKYAPPFSEGSFLKILWLEMPG